MAAATAPSRARARDAAPGRRESGRQRASLEVVAPRRRFRPVVVLVTLCVAAVAFGSLAVQVSLIHRQQRLDAIRAEITAIQQENKELRERESRLQAPAEILRIARDELGMVESRPPELVTPLVERVAAAAPSPTTTAPPGG